MTMKLTGYADKFGVHPGDKIKFYVNCDGSANYKAEIVQMINGDTNPRGPGLIEKHVNAECNGQLHRQAPDCLQRVLRLRLK